jgi:hypothetical protein
MFATHGVFVIDIEIGATVVRLVQDGDRSKGRVSRNGTFFRKDIILEMTRGCQPLRPPPLIEVHLHLTFQVAKYRFSRLSNLDQTQEDRRERLQKVTFEVSPTIRSFLERHGDSRCTFSLASNYFQYSQRIIDAPPPLFGFFGSQWVSRR